MRSALRSYRLLHRCIAALSYGNTGYDISETRYENWLVHTQIPLAQQ